MASTRSTVEGDPPVIDMAAFGAQIQARRAAMAFVDPPRNSGMRRTKSKKALLAALDALGARW